MYLDDLIILSWTADQNIKHVCTVSPVRCIAAVALILNSCKFFSEEIYWMGHMIRSHQLELASHTTDAICYLEPNYNNNQIEVIPGIMQCIPTLRSPFWPNSRLMPFQTEKEGFWTTWQLFNWKHGQLSSNIEEAISCTIAWNASPLGLLTVRHQPQWPTNRLCTGAISAIWSPKITKILVPNLWRARPKLINDALWMSGGSLGFPPPVAFLKSQNFTISTNSDAPTWTLNLANSTG